MYDDKMNAAQTTRPASRIDNEIERVKIMSGRIQRIRGTIVAHARSLGYYEPAQPGSAIGQAPTPVVTSLNDAIAELDREIDQLDGSLNLFH